MSIYLYLSISIYLYLSISIYLSIYIQANQAGGGGGGGGPPAAAVPIVEAEPEPESVPGARAWSPGALSHARPPHEPSRSTSESSAKRARKE